MSRSPTGQLATLRKAATVAEQGLHELSSDTCQLLRSHWQQLLATGEFAPLLYQQLFARLPALAGLFPGDMTEQQARLTHTLDEAIALLDQPPQLVQLLRASGARHVHYQVENRYFDALGESLLAVIESQLGGHLTEQARAHWQQFYGYMAVIMQAAMAESRAQSA